MVALAGLRQKGHLEIPLLVLVNLGTELYIFVTPSPSVVQGLWGNGSLGGQARLWPPFPLEAHSQQPLQRRWKPSERLRQTWKVNEHIKPWGEGNHL